MCHSLATEHLAGMLEAGSTSSTSSIRSSTVEEGMEEVLEVLVEYGIQARHIKAATSAWETHHVHMHTCC
jgi:hypothetical protein